MPRIRRLRSRILVWLASVALVYLVGAASVQQGVLAPRFAALEHDQAVADLDRATAAVRAEISHVSSFVGDWSGWDDTLHFVKDGNVEYVKSNLESNVFRVDSFDFLSLLRLDGTEVWRGGQAPDQSPTVVEELPRGSWPLAHPLLQAKTIEAAATGLVQTSHGPLLLACRPVTDSARQHPPVGWIVMGRFLHVGRVEALAKQTGLTLRVLAAQDPMEPMQQAARERLLRGARHEFVTLDEESLLGFSHLPDLFGAPGMLLQIDLPRPVHAQGLAATKLAMGSTVVGVAVLFAVLFFVLQQLVVRPLTRLTAHAVAIRRSDDLSARIQMGRVDEIGTLADAFDTMVARVAASHEQMVGAARRGGMSEVASAVLHDVGNALQSVVTDLALVERCFASRHAQDLGKVVELLGQHPEDLESWLMTDPKGRKVAVFLAMLGKALHAEHQEARTELTALAAGVAHVQALVAAQQANAGSLGAIERVALPALIEHAERLALGTLPSGTLTVAHDFTKVPEIHTDKHRLLAVVVNLLRNAAESIAARNQTGGSITIALCGDEETVRIEVHDDGVGIDAADLLRIFSGTFTTKPGGHGLGLHGSANTVRQLGGMLRAASGGRGCGATFVIELPVACQALAGAAT